MSETIIVKKKKKIDFELLRKLEKDYDDAINDMESKEEILIKSVHREYLKADNKGEFFDELQKSENWYREKFAQYSEQTGYIKNEIKAETTRKVIAERKIAEFISDFEDDPQHEEWVEQVKAEPAVKFVKQVDFGKYQETFAKIKRGKQITIHDFNVGVQYRLKLVSELQKLRDYYTDLLNKIEVNEYEKT